MNKVVVGAYASAPSISSLDVGENIEREFYARLLQSCADGIQGFELPFWGQSFHQYGDRFIYELLNDSLDNTVSTMPGTVKGLSASAHFGLASNDHSGRAAAISMLNSVNNGLSDLNSHFSQQMVSVVQLATAPTVAVTEQRSSVDQLARSLNEILCLDWQGAKLVIEHCDSMSPHQSKGFMSLQDEIKAIELVGGGEAVGITINWGRSAIEGKSVQTPLDHLELVKQADLLHGLMFSGVCENSEIFGSWEDSHAPFAETIRAIGGGANESLLNCEQVIRSLNVISGDTLGYTGFKFGWPLESMDIESRLKVNIDGINYLQQCVSESKVSLQ